MFESLKLKLSDAFPFVTKKKWRSDLEYAKKIYADQLRTIESLHADIARKNDVIKSELKKEFEQKNKKLRKAFEIAREHHIEALNSTENKKATEYKYQQVKTHLRMFRIATAAHLDRMVEAMTSVRDQMPKNLWDMMAEDKEALESMAAINVDGRTLQDIRDEWQEKQRDELVEIAEAEVNQMLSDQLLYINVDKADKLKVEV